MPGSNYHIHQWFKVEGGYSCPICGCVEQSKKDDMYPGWHEDNVMDPKVSTKEKIEKSSKY